MSKEDFKDAYPVFTMKTTNDTDCIQFKYIGWTKEPEKVKSELIEINTDSEMMNKAGKNSYYIGKFGSYDVFARFYACRVLGNYLLSHDKIPVFYMTVIYEKKFLTGNLFNYFLYFTIDSESRKELKKPKNYINKTVYGKFTLELVDDTDLLERIREDYPQYVEEYLLQQNKDLSKKDISIDEMQKMIEDAKSKKDNIIKDILELFKPFEISFKSKKHVIEKLMFNFCSKIPVLVHTGIKIRDNDRTGDNEASYEFPEKGITIDELKKKYINEDDLL